MDDKQFLQALREYIEEAEELIEGDRGDGSSIEVLLAEKRMPDLYYEVLRRLELA